MKMILKGDVNLKNEKELKDMSYSERCKYYNSLSKGQLVGAIEKIIAEDQEKQEEYLLEISREETVTQNSYIRECR